MKRIQKFVVTIETNDKDGCGEIIPAYSAGDVRSSLIRGLPTCESVTVEEACETYRERV